MRLLMFNISVKVYLILFVIIGYNSQALTITSAATGNWSAGATWVGGVAPSPTDNVIIASSHIITVNGAYTCANLTIGSSNNSPTLKITTVGNSLTITGLLTMNSGNFSGTYNLGSI